MNDQSGRHAATFNVPPFRVRMVLRTTGVSLAHFDHPTGADLPVRFSAHQAAERFRINIVQRGWFRLRYGRREWTLGPGNIFLSRPDDEYQYSHLRNVEPDACLRMEFFAPLPDDVADSLNRLSLVLPLSNRLAFLRQQLCSVASADAELSLDALACEIVEAARDEGAAGHPLYRPRQLEWYAERIVAARAMIDADPAAQHSLWRLSSQVAMSPFHFTRVFGQLIGVPPHKYLIRVRLERSRDLLRTGMSVTDACHAAGFNNLSHFIRTFHARYGVNPSSVKTRTRERRRSS